MSVTRVLVEKKNGFNILASQLFTDIRENLAIYGLQSVRVICCYDLEDNVLSHDELDVCVRSIFSEPPVDMVHHEDMLDNELSNGAFVFGVRLQPGQYDQRSDSAMQCIQAILQKESPLVVASVFYIFGGEYTDGDRTALKRYLINPVDSVEIPIKKPETLKMPVCGPDDIAILNGFISMTDSELKGLRTKLSLVMSESDLLFCRDYFKNDEKRDPSETEIKVIDTYWSDHCRHTTFLTNINNIVIEDGKYKPAVAEAFEMYKNERGIVYGEKVSEKPICLMDIAVMGMRALKRKGFLKDLDESDEINACSIVIPVDVDGVTEDWLLMFKNETHNHPTEIEPFGGAATCLGGAIRDPLSGRAYVYQAMRVTGSGDPFSKISDTIPGKLPQRKITSGAAAGYSSYGNQIGLSTGAVHEFYDEGFVAKRMEIGAVIAAAKKEHVRREKPEPGDLVVVVGGRTGRDGCGGATGSSKEHTEDSISNCGAEVQKGNAPTERKLQRLFRNPEAALLIKRCNDFGAGGVSVAIGELAEGIRIDLNSIKLKYDGLNGTELSISESQERMAVVVNSEDAERFITLAADENLEAVIAAEITGDRRLTVVWRDKEIVSISRDFLDTNGVRQCADVYVSMPDNVYEKRLEALTPESWLNNLKDLNVACQKGLVERFDATVGAGTVLMPFGGKEQLTPPEAMAAKIPVLGDTNTVSLMSFGYNPKIANISPFHAAVYAVVESVSKIAATGGDYKKIRLTLQEYFERLGDDSSKWGKPFSALLGAYLAQMKLGVPAIGGKDSMSGTFMDLNVPPTLVSFAVTALDNENIISPEFKKAGSLIVKLSAPYDSQDLPDFDSLKHTLYKLHEVIVTKHVVSAHSIGIGGMAAALSKMAFGNGIGFDVKLDGEVFSPEYGSFVLECDCSESELMSLFGDINFEVLGRTTAESDFLFNGLRLSAKKAMDAWLFTFDSLFSTWMLRDNIPKVRDFAKTAAEPYKGIKLGIAKPTVILPVFPGTNCEYDVEAAFIKAGAHAEQFVMKNLTVSELEQSIKLLAMKISQGQILAFSGGFSAGDEPEGSGKFIAAVFRNPYLKEAVHELLNRQGLILGICNGFQALVKLGLLPYGEITEIGEDSPTVTFNEIGRHISLLCRTKVVSKKSPWLHNCELDEVHLMPISHGEGRVVLPDALAESLFANGQIATQYVDQCGLPTYDIRFNPNGSYHAIEGMTNHDGRIFGKMGHSERIGNGLYRNIPGNKDQKLFRSGVRYFE